MVVMALRQGFGESGGASGHIHVAPTGLGGLGSAAGCKHAAYVKLKISGMDGCRGPAAWRIRRHAQVKSEGRSPNRPRPRASAFGFQSGAPGCQHPHRLRAKSSARSAMFIAATTPEVPPSSVGAAWMVVMALRQGFGESSGASGPKHAAPTGLGGSWGALGYKHAAPTGLGGSCGAPGYKHVAPTGLVRVLERAIKEAKADLRPSDWE